MQSPREESQPKTETNDSGKTIKQVEKSNLLTNWSNIPADILNNKRIMESF